jgi:Regulator of Chromosome Condensation (RCC1) repeat protein/VCBS repeat protein
MLGAERRGPAWQRRDDEHLNARCRRQPFECVEIAADSGYACAVLTDGTVQCWGSGPSMLAADEAAPAGLPPVAVEGLSNVVEIAAGPGFACARLSDGTVRCWGGNESGQVGDGTTSDRSVPVVVQGLSDAQHRESRVGHHHGDRSDNGDQRLASINGRVAGTTRVPAAAAARPQTVYLAGQGATETATGDFNGKGLVDVAVANTTGTVSGRLGPQAQTTVGSAGAWAIATADVNGDGVLDLIVGDSGNGNVNVLLGSGTGTFAAPIALAAGRAVHSELSADRRSRGTIGRPRRLLGTRGRPKP